MGLLGQGIWGSFSDLLGDLSALSSYEDALAEAMYEELDHLVTQKESLLGSPGGCLCLPFWDLWLSHPLGAGISSASADPYIPQAHRGGSPKRQDGLSQPCEPPASVYTARARPVPSQP